MPNLPVDVNSWGRSACYPQGIKGLFFDFKYIVKDLEIPNEYKGYPVVGIDSYAFCNRKFETVTLPDTIEFIGDGAFVSCYNLTSVNFTATPNLELIGEEAFAYCDQLSKLTIENSEENIINSTKEVEIENYAFGDCTSLAELTFIHESLKTIEADAFVGTNVKLHYTGTPDDWNGKTDFDSEYVNFDKFNVKFYDYDSKYIGEIVVNDGDTFDYKPQSRVGYTFLNYVDEYGTPITDENGNSLDPVEENLYLTAKYEANKYTITYSYGKHNDSSFKKELGVYNEYCES